MEGVSQHLVRSTARDRGAMERALEGFESHAREMQESARAHQEALDQVRELQEAQSRMSLQHGEFIDAQQQLYRRQHQQPLRNTQIYATIVRSALDGRDAAGLPRDFKDSVQRAANDVIHRPYASAKGWLISEIVRIRTEYSNGVAADASRRRFLAGVNAFSNDLIGKIMNPGEADEADVASESSRPDSASGGSGGLQATALPVPRAAASRVRTSAGGGGSIAGVFFRRSKCGR